ncbi:MAG TPA: alpha/beta hydrolase, partial [Verrucomicrobiae bacterium]|nr:alpha/beta hydrolase [Verrucomicrobiae bacterium]
WNRLPDLHRLTLPALVLVGAYDFATPLSAKLLRAALPNGWLILFPDSAHSPFLDEPEAYFGALTGFLRGQ